MQMPHPLPLVLAKGTQGARQAGSPKLRISAFADARTGLDARVERASDGEALRPAP